MPKCAGLHGFSHRRGCRFGLPVLRGIRPVSITILEIDPVILDGFPREFRDDAPVDRIRLRGGQIQGTLQNRRIRRI
ncbi:MAG: hypothetical protein M1436_01765 [Acidobacteria bacterium]|nr:hypothetical protein [Acidobacteriota bacterium]